MKTVYKHESQMYLDVTKWLKEFLNNRYKRRNIIVEATPQTKLYRWLELKGLQDYFSDYLAYDIKIDVTGIVYNQNNALFAFVECKLKPISLKDVSQLLGYSRVAQPKYSIIISPSYISRPISELFMKFSRYDILSYGDNRKIRIAKWDYLRKTVSLETILPPGEHL